MVWQNSSISFLLNPSGFKKSHFVLANFCDNFIVALPSREALGVIAQTIIVKKGKAKLILECAHCGNKAEHFLLCEVDSVNHAYSPFVAEEDIEFECSYYLTKCIICGGISLYYDDEFDLRRGYITEATLCYPVIKNASKEIPKQIRKTYHEALKVEKVSYAAFALLVRKTLELLCKDQKAQGSNLKTQLDDLSKRGIIPETLGHMADALRILGNISAHDGDYEIVYPEIHAMKDFIIAMLEYVYVAPAKIKAFQESMKKRKSNST